MKFHFIDQKLLSSCISHEREIWELDRIIIHITNQWFYAEKNGQNFAAFYRKSKLYKNVRNIKAAMQKSLS